MQQAYALLNEIARQAVAEDIKVDAIANEKPFDSSAYAQAEARRNLLYDIGLTVQRHFKMDDAQAHLAFNEARRQAMEKLAQSANSGVIVETVTRMECKNCP